MKQKHALDADASSRTLEGAIRTQSQVVLEFPAYPNQSVNGFLISGDQKAILLEITGRPSLNPADLVNATCHVRLYSDQRYEFASEVTAAPQWGETRSLALTRPATLNVLERRRFVRAKLAPSSKVTLEWMTNGESHRHTASLLNISADGLACRIEDAVAGALEGAASLRARFDLPGGARTFRLTADVSNRTPASGEHTILGLQFRRTPDQAPQLEALKESLGRYTDVNREAEVPA